MSKPTFTESAWDLTKSIGRFVKYPFLVTKEQYQRRLEICHACEFRDNHRCGKCNCIISLKAQAPVWDCPENKWPKLTKPEE